MKRSTRRFMTVSAAAAGITLLSAGSALAQPNQPGPGDIEQAPQNHIYVTVGNVHGAEGDQGTKLLPVVVKLSKASADPQWVQVKTADGPNPAAHAPADYQAIALATVQFAPGQTQKVFNVIVKGDTFDEPNEHVSVNVTGKSAGLSVLDPTGDAMITDDDTPILMPPPKGDDQPEDQPEDQPQDQPEDQPQDNGGQGSGGGDQGGGAVKGGQATIPTTVASADTAGNEQMAIGADDDAGVASERSADQSWLFIALLGCMAGIALVLIVLARRRRHA